MQAMTMKKMAELMPVFWRTRRPIYLWGKSGCGKSTHMHNWVLRMKKDLGQFNMIDCRASTMDPMDVAGLPGLDKSQGETIENWIARFVPFDRFPNEERDGQYGVLMLEELSSAPEIVQTALYQLLFDRKIGNYELPEGWWVVALGNRTEDNGVVFETPSPVANRFINHILINPDVDDFFRYSLREDNNLRIEPAQYLKFRPENAFTYDPTNEEVCDKCFGSFRTWSYVSELMDAFEAEGMKIVGNEDFELVVKNCVGDGAGGEFCSFLVCCEKCPDLKEMIKNPETHAIPSMEGDNASIGWAVTVGLFNHSNIRSAPAIIKIGMRLPLEFSKVLFDLCEDIVGFKECTQFYDWQMKCKHIRGL